MLKAIEAAPAAQPIVNPEAWLFRIAHRAALDFLRRRSRQEGQHSDEALDMIASPQNPVGDRQIAAASLRTLMRLPLAQRSSVVLGDVLGHSLQETAEIADMSVPGVKAALAARTGPAAGYRGGARRGPSANPDRAGADAVQDVYRALQRP